MSDQQPPQETRHAATDPAKCEEMERRYGWKYLRWERTGGDILKVDCIFEGEALFPPGGIGYSIKDEDDDA